MRLVPKNWTVFQHYKNRCPPWIKLHREILNDRVYMSLPVASKALAPLLWLLASESKDGSFDADFDELEFRLRIDRKNLTQGLKPLIDKGFFIDASGMLAQCLQDATPERETELSETKTEKEERPRKRGAPLECPSDVDPKTWDDWLTLRRAKKAPVTETVVNQARKEASSAFMELDAFLQVWCMRGSQGLQADWLKPNERDTPSRVSFADHDEQKRQRRWEEMTGRKWPEANGTFIDLQPADILSIGANK